jgi:hypothetical protein
MNRHCRLSIHISALFSSLLSVALCASIARAQTVLTFDEVNAGAALVPIPAGYGGVSWSNNMGIFGFDQSPYIPQSLPNRVLFNLHDEVGVVESIVTFIGGPKAFVGAYFSGYEDVQFNLYSPLLVGTSSVLHLGNGSGPTFLPSGYAGLVSSVGIVGFRGIFTMDNFTYQVPEPPSLCLALIGVLAIGIRARNQSTNNAGQVRILPGVVAKDWNQGARVTVRGRRSGANFDFVT